MSLAEDISETEDSTPELPGAQLDGRFRIDLSARLSFLDRGQNQAFKAVDLKNPAVELFAVVSSPFVPYRQDFVDILSVQKIPGLVELHAYGPARFGKMDIRFVFIFQMPKGSLVFNQSDGPLEDRAILDKIVPQLIETLSNLEKTKTPHRGIRADNLFYDDLNGEKIILGESVTTPPGSDQPDVYEPIESANAHKFGRGTASISSDVYSLGVLIVHLLTGSMPLLDKTTEQVFVSKLENGSFATLTEGLALSSRMGLLLKGLLHDNPDRRWDLEILGRWREIMHDNAKIGTGDRSGLATLSVSGQDFDSPRLLANALSYAPKEACDLLISGKLATWVKKSLRDNETAEKISRVQTISRSKTRGSQKSELTATAQICNLLFPSGAIRYRELSFGDDGIPGLLSFAFQNDDSAMKASLDELLGSGILTEILGNIDSSLATRRKGILLQPKLADCVEYIKNKDRLGFGLERCFYELNPTAPCLSPSMIGSHVTTMARFMKVVEKKLTTPGNQINPFDRHCAAFIAAKATGQGKRFHQMGLGKPGSAVYTVGLLKLFGQLQSIYHPGPLPGFCLWSDSLLKPLISGLKSELRRQFVMKRFEVARKSGNMGSILAATDIQQHIKKDEKEFLQAKSSFTGAEQMAVRLEAATEERKAAATQYGNWIASVLSITALLTSMGLTVLHFLG
jgi:eukaryotic-like serine/threonine-protein kinase